MARTLLFVLIVLANVSPSAAETRAAFIVGNAHYENASNLENPIRDANQIATTLRTLDFDVSLHIDLTRSEFADALSEFLIAHTEADVTFFYYAGHGIQFEGENYLLGTDASLRSEFDISSEAIALTDIVGVLERRSKAALVFIDACRDNPLAQAFYQRNFPQTRSLETRGLAPVKSTFDGTMIMFSASPGQVAYDGDGNNSPFSLALSRHLPDVNVEVLSLMKRVIRDVRNLTGGLQNPTVTNDLSKDVYLRQVTIVAPEPTGPTPAELAAREWGDFRGSRSQEALQAFAERHAGTAYAALARERAAQLKEKPTKAMEIAPAPASLPAWCEKPKSMAETEVCKNTVLLELDSRLSERLSSQLDLAKGAVRGRALVDQRNWRLERDGCHDDAECIARSYELRILALEEFSGKEKSPAMIAREVQVELNRLSCGAGEPDGVVGAQTRQAIAELSRLEPTVSVNSDPTAQSTLETLRGLPIGVCSVINRAGQEPELIAGTWDIRATCPERSGFPNETLPYTMVLKSDGDKRFSGSFVRGGGFSGVIVAKPVPGSMGAYVVWRDGSRSSVRFLPGQAPFELGGVDHWQCSIFARKR